MESATENSTGNAVVKHAFVAIHWQRQTPNAETSCKPMLDSCSLDIGG